MKNVKCKIYLENSRNTNHESRVTSFIFRLTTHNSRLTPNVFRLTTHDSRLTYFFSLLTIFFLLFSLQLHAITIAEITSNEKYIYGLGEANGYEEAYAQALQNLINRISVQVEAELTLTDSEDETGRQQKIERIITTYSSTTLYSIPEMVEQGPNKTRVWLYYLKDDVDEIFADRQRKIESYYQLGIAAEKKVQIGDALRNYYWALELLTTHPQQDRMCSPSIEETGLILKAVLHTRINELLNGINFEQIQEFKEENGRKLIYNVTYKAGKVTNLNYRYYTSSGGWSKYICVNDGLAYVHLPSGFHESTLTLQIEYRYEQAANFDKEVRTVLNGIAPEYFSASQRDIILNENSGFQQKSRELVISPAQTYQATETISELNILKKVLDNIAEDDIGKVAECFTETGLADYKKLLCYGQAELLTNELDPEIKQSINEKQMRDIPMKFSFPNSNTEFIEKVNFKFDTHNLITGITFGLSESSIKAIMAQDESIWKTEEKYRLIDFMEYYKTAYCLQDIDFIDRVFAENALIIVGRVLQDDDYKMENINETISEDKVEYIRMKKDEYITHLKQVFASNEFVNLQFEDNCIKHYSNDPDSALYAIQINQNYYSENYGDKGYLFLMMDLKDLTQPRIYIRSWQPEKFPDGSIFGVNDFKME
ncbi:MAG: LPP20 family lipoprotein [Candidatus Cloacimonetes bacterium]|nr:LPP20 family lipoprotein [Candidatus Cloacimonadota bacterium]